MIQNENASFIIFKTIQHVKSEHGGLNLSRSQFKVCSEGLISPSDHLTNGDLLSIRPLGTNFSEIGIKM